MDESLYGLVLADTHAFSAWGLTPENFILSTGSVLNLNPGQRYLWNCYQHMLDVSRGREVDFLILNGDLGEGTNPKERGLGVNEPDPKYQARGVVSLLEPVINRMKPMEEGKRHIRMQAGSKYHTGLAAAIEEEVGEKIGSIPDRFGRHARPWGRFYVDDVYFDCAHRQSVAINQAGVLGAEIDKVLLRFARQRQAVPEHIVIIRSHTHAGFYCVERRGITAILTPAFKLQDDFTQMSTSPNRFIPDNIGAVGLEIHPKGSGKRVKVLPYTYDHPELGDDVEVLL